MNAPQFMAHVLFQQRGSEYRAGERDRDRLLGEAHPYPDTPEEEALNAEIGRQTDVLDRVLSEMGRSFGKEQWGVVQARGRFIERADR